MILNKLIEKKDLTGGEINFFLEGVIDGSITPVQAGAILTALSIKGETVSEISSLVKAMQEKMVKIEFDGAIDVCGTGGDKSGSFNISTAVAFVVAGAGVPVAKHGNRAASSKCGSADVLEELGVNINLSADAAKKVLQKVKMVFLFAPLFHPATKNVVVVRKDLKIRTVFNFLGPFLNPTTVKKQIIGVLSKDIAEKLIKVAKSLGYEHLLIVASRDGMDEISLSSKTDVFEFKKGVMSNFEIDPKDFGFEMSTKTDIAEGDLSENAKFITDVLDGVKGPRRDIVVLNSAAALYVSGKARNISDGIRLAKESIDSGSAKNILSDLVKETQNV